MPGKIDEDRVERRAVLGPTIGARNARDSLIFIQYATMHVTMTTKETVTIYEYSYTVIFEPDETGGYVVTCPALPAVITQGDSIEEARVMAADAIHLVLQSMIEEGEPIPSDVESPHRKLIREKVTVAVQTV